MKRILAVTVGVLLTASLIPAVHAAPAKNAARPKAPVGVQNAKKVRIAAQERDKKVREIQKKARAQKELAPKTK